MRPSEIPPWSIAEEHKKKQTKFNFVIGAEKKKHSLYSKKTPICHKIVGTGVRSRKQVGVFGSKPVKPSNFDVRTNANKFGCVFVSFFFLKPLRKTALRLASISVVCHGPCRANPRMHPQLPANWASMNRNRRKHWHQRGGNWTKQPE